MSHLSPAPLDLSREIGATLAAHDDFGLGAIAILKGPDSSQILIGDVMSGLKAARSKNAEMAGFNASYYGMPFVPGTWRALTAAHPGTTGNSHTFALFKRIA